jgi:hypothetical protein
VGNEESVEFIHTTTRLRHGHELPNGGRYVIEQIEGNYKLIIKEAWDIDDGEYTVEMSNPFGMGDTFICNC